MSKFQKYGLLWPDGTHPLQLEFEMLRRVDGKVKTPHYLAIHKLLWPEDEQHRWFVLGLKSIVENDISVFLGCASSGKTYTMAVHALIDFFCFPKTSFALISSTEKRSLEIKVWGRVKELFNRAKHRHSWLSGYVLESSMAITPEDIDEEGDFARALNVGLVCVPCVSGGRFVGMGKFQGAKPPHTPGKFDGRLKHYGDEAAVMQASFLDAYSNWMVNNSGKVKAFKGVMSGNPTDISDPLCVASEPEGGWDSYHDNSKTQEWFSKWYGAHVVAFDGRDTPNNDDPNHQYPFLISKEFVDGLRLTHGEDSWQLFQQGIGKPSRGMVSNRVITIGLCERNKAFETPVWNDKNFTDIYAVDVAYGGGDRCVGMKLRMGFDIHAKQIVECFAPEIIPIRLNANADAEEQISEFLNRRLDELNIKPENCFYDSFGRGTLGGSLAKKFGSNSPIPVDSGARPTTRPVRFDLFVEEKDGRKRHKRCDEHYSKLVTEFWFSTREAIESQQIRSLPKSVADEGQLRLYEIVSGNRIEVEAKDEMKKRIRKSPDLYDCFAIGIEGCRQRGLRIQRMPADQVQKGNALMDWFIDQQRISRESRSRTELRRV